VTASNVRSKTVGAKGYVNPDSTVKVQLRLTAGDVQKPVFSQAAGVTTVRSETWTDQSPSSLTLKPKTAYSVDTRLWNTAGWSDWGANCSGTTKAPPVPAAPSISSSKNNTGRTITWSWGKPTNANIFGSTGAFIYTGTQQSRTLTSQPYGAQKCVRVRAAYSNRLASWGYWGPYSGNSCQTLVSPVPPAPNGWGLNVFTPNMWAYYIGNYNYSGSISSYQYQYRYTDPTTGLSRESVISGGAVNWSMGPLSMQGSTAGFPNTVSAWTAQHRIRVYSPAGGWSPWTGWRAGGS